MSSPSLKIVALALASLVLVALTPAISSARVAAAVWITLTPGSAHPGDVVAIDGYDDKPLGPDCVLRVRGAGSDKVVVDGGCSVDAKGNITGKIGVPADLQPMTLEVAVCVGRCLDVDEPDPPVTAMLVVASAEIEEPVQPFIVVSPDTVQPGAELTFTGAGPVAETDLECDFEVIPGGSAPVLGKADVGGGCSISATGSIDGSFTAPAAPASGAFKVNVFCGKPCWDADGTVDGWSAAGFFFLEPSSVDPSISVNPNPASPGGVVTITGTGPASADDRGCFLTVTRQSTDTPLSDDGGSCTITAAGVIGGSFSLPADLQPGDVGVTVCVGRCLDGDDPGPAATATLVVEASPVVATSVSVSPNPANPGDLVTVSGTGPNSVGDQGCDLTATPNSSGTPFSDDSSSCSITDAGVISGALRVPADLEPGDVRVSVCVGRCLDVDDPSPATATTLVIEAISVVTASISTSPNSAHPGDVVTIIGSGPTSADTTGCGVALDSAPVDAVCSINSAGDIIGSFTVPAETQPGDVQVTVCEPGCDDGAAATWRASAVLAVAAELAPSTTVVPDAGVLIPDLTALSLQDAEKILTAASLGMDVTGDHGGSVSGQEPAAGERVPAGTVVLVTFSDVPAPAADWPVLLAIAVVVIVVIGGTALTIRQHTRRPKDSRWVDKHVSVEVKSQDAQQRSQTASPDDIDIEVKIVVTALDESAAILEVQP